MRQFLLPRSFAGESRLVLTGGDYRHLVRVLRLRAGDEMPAVDARGTRYTMRIARVGRAECGVEIAPSAALSGDVPPASITLLQCLPKGRKIDLIVRQATEAGVSRIVLLASERSLARAHDEANRVSRLRRVAREALQQIFEYSKGIPRLVNLACDNALLVGYSSETHLIDSGVVARAISQMLPNFAMSDADIVDVDPLANEEFKDGRRL
jgi:RsmE family RNA methyltransferase